MTAIATTVTEGAGQTEQFAPGVYVTDGIRLFRVISPGQSLFPSAELEDCITLEVHRYFSDELFAMRLHRVDSAGL
jgi:hypothetical protein